ncbi:SRPBCC family protein [Malaciobacter mytili]|uniref:Ribosome association toxin RatA n=1 Tax=Malaciobacter mytili LMG 24559 TaxID=1032238 RepID=A0AAX2AG56_9BACT|nr:SRPBCC family protein [Malaciobacter mytili]AXH15322.1 hypothetical protein AMYT_1750 [Malaciobacter mytili LMG 24559]RXK15719.1 hypothetical protein CP985_07360 [Malaciobacter mytili LMG 24559]
MKTFTKETYINTTLEELFAFHMDTNNLLKITPSNIKATLLTKNIQPKEGQVISLKTTKNFLSFLWIIRIKKIEYPKLFIDEALKSPFKFWEHQHIFEKRGNKVLLKDVVRYELPFGFIGRIFSSFIQSDLEKMFDFRHKVTKNILEGKI